MDKKFRVVYLTGNRWRIDMLIDGQWVKGQWTDYHQPALFFYEDKKYICFSNYFLSNNLHAEVIYEMKKFDEEPVYIDDSTGEFSEIVTD